MTGRASLRSSLAFPPAPIFVTFRRKLTETIPSGRGSKSALPIFSRLQSRDQRERLEPLILHRAGKNLARYRAAKKKAVETPRAPPPFSKESPRRLSMRRLRY